MGGAFAKMFSWFWRPEEARLLFLGLDAAGKTTILYKLKLGEVVQTIPTIGFNVETIEYRGIKLTSWDVGGRGKTRALHRHYYHNTDAVIYVIDANDRDRIEEARDELSAMLREDELQNVVLLVFANKQDLPNAMSVTEVTEKLGLNKIDTRTRQWHVQGTTATSGDGLYEGLDFLSTAIRNQRTGKWTSQVIPPPKTFTPAPGVQVVQA